jgi:putative NIF3 family GTP cyclohydrolase 1 type 2
MNAKKLYEQLDTDFELDKCSDEFGMDYNEYISDNFKERKMGVLVDNTEQINEVHTAVFPSDKVLEEVLASGRENVLLFTHHPINWDIRNAPKVFSNIDKELLRRLQERKISIYTLHVPLDKNGEYSTSTNYAKAIGVSNENEFCEYYGVLIGVIGKAECKTVEELAERVKSAVGHDVKLYRYGSSELQDVAVVAGGGNDKIVVDQIPDSVNTLVTGISVHNDYSQLSHDLEKERRINLIGATHYSTEKFACIKICEYFKKMGFDCSFIKDDPVMEDM